MVQNILHPSQGGSSDPVRSDVRPYKMCSLGSGNCSRSRFPSNSLPSVRSVTSKVNLWESKGNPPPPIPNPPRCPEITGLNDNQRLWSPPFFRAFFKWRGWKSALRFPWIHLETTEFLRGNLPLAALIRARAQIQVTFLGSLLTLTSTCSAWFHPETKKAVKR